jgi:hypothetical protein
VIGDMVTKDPGTGFVVFLAGTAAWGYRPQRSRVHCRAGPGDPRVQAGRGRDRTGRRNAAARIGPADAVARRPSRRGTADGRRQQDERGYAK